MTCSTCETTEPHATNNPPKAESIDLTATSSVTWKVKNRTSKQRAIPQQTASGKGLSNPLKVISLPKAESST